MVRRYLPGASHHTGVRSTSLPLRRRCDSKSWYDTDECMRKLLAKDWALACDAALRRFINRVDDGDDDPDDGDGVDDEVRVSHANERKAAPPLPPKRARVACS